MFQVEIKARLSFVSSEFILNTNKIHVVQGIFWLKFRAELLWLQWIIYTFTTVSFVFFFWITCFKVVEGIGVLFAFLQSCPRRNVIGSKILHY
jgi:hypothetical protein